MLSLNEILSCHLDSWAGPADGWESRDSIIMEQLRPVTWAMVGLLEIAMDQRHLDVASGTGEPGLTIAQQAPDGRVVLTDPVGEMLDVALDRAEAIGVPNVGSRICSAELLPFQDAGFDSVSVRFGYPCFPDPVRATAEFARVLKPGGRLVILEFERPRFPLMRWFYDFYCGWVMPRTATLISGDKSGAYRYLPRSVGTFMTREELSDLLARSGFAPVTSRGLSLGICVCYRGVRGG